MDHYMIDTSAWVEYFKGGKLGGKVKAIVDDKNAKVSTNVLCVAELVNYFKKRGLDFTEAKKILRSLSIFYTPSFEFCVRVGELYSHLRKQKKKISFIDTFILLTARETGAKVLTKDTDFAGLKDVCLLK